MLRIALPLLAMAATAGGARELPALAPAKADMLVGAFYFPGWERPESWYCLKANQNVRQPLLGYYREGDPKVADWHIRWAAEHGVGFFAFDYYTEGGSQMLEHGLDGFLASRYIGATKFCLNWCNHSDASRMTADELERFGDLAIRKYLVHPSCLRIEDRPVVMILAGYSFVRTLGVDGARKAFMRFDERCREAGLKGVYLVFCEGGIMNAQAVRDSFAAGARAFCLYNYPYAGTTHTGPGKHGEATYSHLVEQGEGLWKHWRGITNGRFWPTVMAGWDRRPWTKDLDLIRTGLTPELFADSLRRSRRYANPQRVVMVEAWNEWGEGSILEPSLNERFAYLDAVRRVMCPSAPPHRDVDPAGLGLARPAYDLHLPSTDAWSFNRDAEGWTRMSTTEPDVSWGALRLKSLNGDPQLTSPITYLRCADYARAVIRMRVTGVPGGPTQATAQLFWSTTEHGIEESSSIHFAADLDGKWHEYDLDLAAARSWKGTTDRFRFDPVDVGGVQMDIDHIRFVRGTAARPRAR